MSYDMGIYEARSWYNTAIHTGPNGEWSIEATISEFTGVEFQSQNSALASRSMGLSFSGDTAAGQSNTYSGSPAFRTSTHPEAPTMQPMVARASSAVALDHVCRPDLISAIVSYGAWRGRRWVHDLPD
jgi:hypothetical protein